MYIIFSELAEVFIYIASNSMCDVVEGQMCLFFKYPERLLTLSSLLLPLFIVHVSSSGTVLNVPPNTSSIDPRFSYAYHQHIRVPILSVNKFVNISRYIMTSADAQIVLNLR